MKRVIPSFVLLVLFAVAFAPPLYAQKISGDITGTVTDQNGAVVPGAAVTATCTTTKLVRATVSGEGGGYRLSDLPICVYKVSITMQGFKTLSRDAQVAVSSTTKADFRLSLGQLSEEITVEGVTPMIEFSDKLNNYVDQERVNEMPLNGRDFNSLLSIVPGVQRAPGGGFQSINISGQRAESNNFMVDGISNNDRYYGDIAFGTPGVVGLISTVIPSDAIQEFTVQQTPGAEFGVKGGAAINIVMKSGTNEFHGSVYYFRHDDWMDAKNFFTEKSGGDKTPLKNQQFGGTFGGPLVKDRTFFFGYFEGQRAQVGTPYRVFVPSPDQVTQARARIAEHIIMGHVRGEVRRHEDLSVLDDLGVDYKKIMEDTDKLRPVYDKEFLRKYVAHSKRYVPVMSKDARKIIQEKYLAIRKLGEVHRVLL